MESPSNEAVFSHQVLEMLTVANEYCLFIEKSENYTLNDILEYLLKISPLLYLKGSLLPKVFPEDEEYNERFLTEQEWEDIYNILKNKFGKNDGFSKVDPGNEIEKETSTFSLAEICCDIYQDLHDFVMLYQKNTKPARENAVFQCYEYFKNNWGPKILTSLPHLHSLVFWRDDSMKESDF